MALPSVAVEADATVITADGRTIAGRLVRFELPGDLVILPAAGGETQVIPSASVLRLRCGDHQGIDTESITLDLANGDRLVGRIGDSAPDAIAFDSRALGRLTVALDVIRTIHMPGAYRSIRQAPGVVSVDDGAPDVLLLSNGDALRGFIASIDNALVRIELSGRVEEIPVERVVSVHLAAPESAPSPTLAATLQLATGERITTEILAWRGDAGVQLTHADQRFTLAPAAVAAVEIVSPDWLWLTDLQPATHEQTGMMRLGWEYRTNANVLGEPLRVAGEQLTHGIGVHSRSLLVYELNGRYEQFAGRFALDDGAGPLANVDVAVSVDGRERYRADLTQADGLQPVVSLDVVGARRLELLVDYGRNAAVQDRFDWIEPRLIRHKQADTPDR